jgi:hypothetical protein
MINKALFLAVIAYQTALFAEQFKEGGKPKNPPLTKDEERIKETYFAIGCGGSRSEYRSKIEKQYKEDGKTINPKTWGGDSDSEAVIRFQGAAFVHTGNRNNHNYEIGLVCVFDKGLGSDKETPIGFNLTTTGSPTAPHNYADDHRDCVRPATTAEIESLWPYADKIVGSDFGDAFSKPLNDDNLHAIVDWL